MMWVVGMTGGIGCGKSEVARLFSALGVPIVDVDKISHDLTKAGQPILQKITQAFGQEILLANGELNRPALREKIFSDSTAKKTLENIMHPAIYEQAIQMLANHVSAPYQMIDIPLLFESERYLKLINRSLVVDCEPSLQISRTCQRSQMNEEEVKRIIAAQMPREQRNQRADDILLNNGSLQELEQKVAQLHEKYMNTCIFNK